jgi:hypothetical protein
VAAARFFMRLLSARGCKCDVATKVNAPKHLVTCDYRYFNAVDTIITNCPPIPQGVYDLHISFLFIISLLQSVKNVLFHRLTRR